MTVVLQYLHFIPQKIRDYSSRIDIKFRFLLLRHQARLTTNKSKLQHSSTSIDSRSCIAVHTGVRGDERMPSNSVHCIFKYTSTQQYSYKKIRSNGQPPLEIVNTKHVAARVHRTDTDAWRSNLLSRNAARAAYKNVVSTASYTSNASAGKTYRTAVAQGTPRACLATPSIELSQELFAERNLFRCEETRR